MRIIPILAHSLALLSFTLFGTECNARCNGDSALCSKRYNQVVYVTTQNAFNYSPAFQLPNQSFPVSHQMMDGVRPFMLDVHNLLGASTLYRGNYFQ